MKSQVDDLATEAVQSAALAFESVDDIHGGDGLAFGVLGVGDRIANDILQEDFQHATGLFVDQTGDAFDATTTGQTANSGFGDALDVVAEDLAMTLGTTFAEALATLSTARHVEVGDGKYGDENKSETMRSERVIEGEW